MIVNSMEIRSPSFVTAGTEQWEFGGRANVFDGLGSCLYLPRDTAATLTAVTDLEIGC